MGYIAGLDRTQRVLFPESLDEYVSAENPVRFIDAFVAELDLEALGVKRAQPNVLGRPAYDPGDLLRLYVYGYLNRVRSSRGLEREARRNVELMWLLRKLTPDFKTIADFRRDNPVALRGVCREFTLLCKRLDLFGGELVAIDGSKFRAVNSRQRNVKPKELERRLRLIDARIAEYLGAMDVADKEADKQEEEGPGAGGGSGGSGAGGAKALREKIEALEVRRQKYTALNEDLFAKGETQRSLTDPDSRLMKVGMGVQVSYNGQIAVDSRHKLIVAHEVTNAGTDQHCLSAMAKASKEVLSVEGLEVLADRGYYNSPEIAACLEAGITPAVPKPLTSPAAKRGLFTKAEFEYDGARDEYQCPAKQRLTYRGSHRDRGGLMQRRYTISGCRSCPLHAQCTKGNRRTILRWEQEALLDQMARRVRERPELGALRQSLSEHPFGSIKRWMDQGYFLTRGLTKVRGEFSLTVLAYNLKRVIGLLGVRRLIEAVTGKPAHVMLATAAAW